MVSTAASLLAEVIVPLVSFVFEMCAHILLASFRPWRYLLSPKFRTKVNGEYANTHLLIKWWHLLWGSVLLVASVAVLVWLVSFWSHLAPEPESNTLRQQAVEKAEQVLIDKLKNRQGGGQ